MSDPAARDAYTVYGVDLVRTAGLLLRTTPSTIYRACLLFLRFEASVETHFRAHYICAADMPALRNTLSSQLQRAQLEFIAASSPGNGSSSPPPQADTVAEAPAGVEYLVPSHVQLKMRTGLVPLIDLQAPLDYSIHHLADQEDIMYLVAACLLVAAKMEDPSTRIRVIVNTCMRLSARRTGATAVDTSKPAPPRYEDYKACVVEAEEVVLHQLGFQTFVDCPYKYVLLYLNLLVEPAAADSTPTGAETAATAAAAASSTRASAVLTQWMVRAVQLVNDLPRCRRLAFVPADALAVYAIQQTCPADLALPPQWCAAFGVPERLLKAIANRYAAYRSKGVGSRRAAAALEEVRAPTTVPLYRTVAEKEQYESTLQSLRQACEAAAAASATAAATPFTAPASLEELQDLIGGVGGGVPLPTDTAQRRPRASSDDDDNILVRRAKREKHHHRHRHRK